MQNIINQMNTREQKEIRSTNRRKLINLEHAKCEGHDHEPKHHITILKDDPQHDMEITWHRKGDKSTLSTGDVR